MKLNDNVYYKSSHTNWCILRYTHESIGYNVPQFKSTQIIIGEGEMAQWIDNS